MPTRKKPTHMVPFERSKKAAVYYDGDQEKFVLVVGYQHCEDDDSVYSYESEDYYDHPLEAITAYEQVLVSGIRPRFGDWLESIGYHRYNGKKQGFEAAAPPRQVHRPGTHCNNCRYGDNGSATCPARNNKARCANGSPIDPGKEE